MSECYFVKNDCDDALIPIINLINIQQNPKSY